MRLSGMLYIGARACVCLSVVCVCVCVLVLTHPSGRKFNVSANVTHIIKMLFKSLLLATLTHKLHHTDIRQETEKKYSNIF